MGLIKNLANGFHYSDKWLCTGNALTGSRGKYRVERKRGKEGVNGDREPTHMAHGSYHFVELIRQLFYDHTESLELLKYAGDVLTRETTDSLEF